jgi:UDP-N-acetylglucosamine--N-acetylmuramyl-(pentapeptide) pyrophosphoryl-undecaprenol N-acetylglucosamine transferase
MSEALSACDLIIARAGATTIAEVSYLGLPVIFVPSTNVAANHQFKNAQSMLEKDACLLIEDKHVNDQLGQTVCEVISDNEALNNIKNNIKKFAKPEAAKIIAKDIIRLAQIKKV